MSGKIQKAKRSTAEAMRRVTGISTPLGGLSWAEPGPSDAKTVRRFIIFLEDRRALYVPFNLEQIDHVESSILLIRKESTEALQDLPPKAFAVIPIRVIREACRRFYDQKNDAFRFFDQRWGQHEGSPGFFTALGVLRATVGQQVALLAAYYDIDIDGDLASALPSIGDDAP